MHRQLIKPHKTLFLICVVIYSSIFGLSNAFGEFSKLERFAIDPFYPAFQKELALERHAKEEIIRRFGEPIKEASVIKPDSRESGTIEHLTLHYNGMTMYVQTDITSAYNRPSWVPKIVITSPKYNLVYDLTIGSDKKHYIEHLGKKYREKNNTLIFNASVYQNFGGVTLHSSHSISITFSSTGKSESITWITHEH